MRSDLQMLIDRREKESRLKLDEFPTAYRELTYPKRRQIIQAIAYYTVRNEEFTIAQTRMQAEVRGILKTTPTIPRLTRPRFATA